MRVDYSRALAIAVEAAERAGDLLRREFHRPGGPRGTTDKAPADTEAEQLVRGSLLAAFPDWGYLGEETGRKPAAAGETHCWVVDPNDGTAAFHRGRRGSALSIGALRDGRPVLGVVFAFAAPDDLGDLFTWAEGLPFERSRSPVKRAPWPGELQPRKIVLLSEGAGSRAYANASLVAPARFAALPSIAYRLALAAAGDGCAAVSLTWPGAWDYCGGHALLLAAGGDLVDQRGQSVTYSREGDSKTDRCFGGGPALVRQLAAMDWSSALRGKPEPPGDYPLVKLRRGENIADAGLLARAQGCLLGQLAGDSLGSAVEGWLPERIREQYPEGVTRLEDNGVWGILAGQPTDDSEMALALARSIVQAEGYEREMAARAYHYWFRSGPFDCGYTTATALSAITRDSVEAGRAAETAESAANRQSQANGSLMRISPLAIWGHALPPGKLAAHARADAALTHPHPVCGAATAVFAIAAAQAIASGGGPGAVYEYASRWARENIREEDVVTDLRDAAERPPRDYLTNAGWVRTAFHNAFYQLLHARTLEEGVVQTVMAGGDTDTNAAIAGALLGAVHGRSAVPGQWRRMVLTCRPVAGSPGVKKPRPRAFWPVDALELAERLLLT